MSKVVHMLLARKELQREDLLELATVQLDRRGPVELGMSRMTVRRLLKFVDAISVHAYDWGAYGNWVWDAFEQSLG